MYIKHWLTMSFLTIVLHAITTDIGYSKSGWEINNHDLLQTQIITSSYSTFQTRNQSIRGEVLHTLKSQTFYNYEIHNNTSKNDESINFQEPYAVHEFKVRNTPTVSIRSNSGSIKVEKSSDGKVRIEMYVTRRGLAILSSERLEDDYRFVFRQRHNNIYAEVISTKNSAWSSSTPSFDFIVFVPEESNASLITNSGNISIAGIQGEMDARTSKGTISVSRTQGTIRLSTASGDVEVDSHKGEVFTNSIHGNINYNNVQGESRIKVVSGNVTLDEIRGSTLVQSTNGNIDYTARRVDQLVDLKTVIGNITAKIPRNGAFSFDFHGQSVNLDSFDNFVGDVQRTYITGTINGGGVPVHATSKLGNVIVQIKQ